MGGARDDDIRPEEIEVGVAALARNGLTRKQAEVAVRVACRYTEEEIAASVKKSVSAVKKLLRGAHRHLGTSGLGQLTRRVQRICRDHRDEGSRRKEDEDQPPGHEARP